MQGGVGKVRIGAGLIKYTDNQCRLEIKLAEGR
jgi:hypothetical protein